ncbi:Uncharacterized membrane protein YoaK, UPF0700 family [Mucilaginibacter mallensis]|uniref:Uncharacterized membrane protein YoaK, UPF0700 family n=1 Tax=Mucilaginibacter mallensis TaxID=652787 RepID=A0A1H2A657_MUCMA|nr:YoaK family protein [Mucilaginibacter mallensis]SDT41455.1 Uncharacterized membrane protein YoaK, UPF0700 family [Mucilaginibacter mallensis]
MLKHTKENRTLKENLMLASSTAFVSGMTNVSGVVAFLAFTANVTGHFSNLAENIIEKNFQQVIVFSLWLFLFFAGSFTSNFLVRWQSHKSNYRANALPIIIEAIILLFVAFYGHHYYEETLREKQVITGAIILSMGLQNGLVSNISGGLIKTSHLTGLFTDLGADIAEWLYPNTPKTPALRNRLYIRFTILGFYFFGALMGGYFFDKYEFAIFYFIPVILFTILYYDLSPIALHKLARLFSTNEKKADI